eukprot:CAMPEP_0183408948 /NCGR_PEP_ID=MMETSP0370-20130417/18453_1 /TAXON_ID=268820 /ORGANISM="Peridinium aciculiferum, Strain PAER-2" /LENGTH=37 /DNA_ID= /DNA_START= /DNA_END= /DNA_ORIENTATION=
MVRQAEIQQEILHAQSMAARMDVCACVYNVKARNLEP